MVRVQTRGYNQDGTVVCVFTRKVMVPKRDSASQNGADEPARPEPKL